MNDRNTPRLTKWPFYLADAALLAVACWVLAHFPHPLAPWAAGLITACVVMAALLAVWPFRLEYETAVRLFESDRLNNAAEAIRNLEDVARQIQQATAQWQGVQDHAGRTTQAAREIADRMTAEARAFSEFMTKANDSEKATLRLEVEKLRRGEGQWLQVLVHTLDHVHALYQAGSRSGQPSLAAQLGAFQGACRDLARRVGLVAIDAEIDQHFDSTQHEVVQGQPQADGPAQIAQVVATGFTYQGQVLRRPVVILRATEESAPVCEDTALGESPAAAGDFDSTAPHGAVASAHSEDAIESAENAGENDVDGVDGSGSAEPSSAVEEFRLESEPLDPMVEDDRRRAGIG